MNWGLDALQADQMVGFGKWRFAEHLTRSFPTAAGRGQLGKQFTILGELFKKLSSLPCTVGSSLLYMSKVLSFLKAFNAYLCELNIKVFPNYNCELASLSLKKHSELNMSISYFYLSWNCTQLKCWVHKQYHSTV